MNNLKSRAFLVFCEFGPDRAIHRHQRLTQLFPELTSDVIDSWITDFKSAEKVAFDIAIQHRQENWKVDKTIKILEDRIPDFNHEALSKLLNQACYFAMHDGY